MSEQILVIPPELVKQLSPKVGFTFASFGEEDAIIKRILDAHTWADRDWAETSLTVIQVIPYVVVSDVSLDKTLLIQRTPKQAEARLHNKYSLGVGGHITSDTKQGEFDNIITASMHRELAEELKYNNENNELAFMGTIYIPEGVNAHHFALVYSMALFDGESVESNEPDKMTVRWATQKEIAAGQNFEAWSAALAKFFFSEE